MEDIRVKLNNPVSHPAGWQKPALAAKDKEPPKSSTGNISKVDDLATLAKTLSEVNQTQKKSIEAIAERIQAFMDASSHSLQFIPNRENGQVIIKVLDSSGKEIRQIPPEEMVRLSSKLGETSGLLLDEMLE